MPRIKILIIESDDAASALVAVREALFPETAQRMPPVLQAIIDATCQELGVDKAMVIGTNSRVARIALARKVIYYLIRLYTEMSSSELGQYLRRDHSTILVGASNLNSKLAYDRALSAHLDVITKRLQQEGHIP
jgi:chromosomal replication initiation ATPase DnaA